MITNKRLRAIMVAVVLAAGWSNASLRADDPKSPYDKDKDRADYADKKLTTAHFVHKAVFSGLKEVRLGEVAKEKAMSTEVRDYATRIVTDHQQVNDRLTSLARQKGLPVPDTNSLDKPYGHKPEGDLTKTDLDRDQPARNVVNAELPPREDGKDNTIPSKSDGKDQGRRAAEMAFDELRRLSGAEFDRAYISHLIMSHNRSVSLFSKASQELDDPEIKSFALETLPKLREHLRDAERISTEVMRTNF
jgi:putative membrane protein